MSNAIENIDNEMICFIIFVLIAFDTAEMRRMNRVLDPTCVSEATQITWLVKSTQKLNLLIDRRSPLQQTPQREENK